ncbi:transposable element Tcb1 transposase [Trichonephila clavipes]|nr:transposable element Tcb1 transposase [Trichonephila clavipes]
MEVGWSARRVRQLSYSDCVVSDSLPQINLGVKGGTLGVPTPCVGTPISSRTLRRHLAEGHLGSWCPLRVLLLTPTHRTLRLEWCSARGNWTVVEWTPLVLIHGTMTAQWYVHDILVPHALPLMQRLPGAIFQQDNARPHGKSVTRLSPHCYNPSLVCPIHRIFSHRAY